ncbi:type I CRISPR-associated protein Cas7 [Chitinophaga qingshengii]|uniref:Type I CRISPR-associated protein Cas7 n=1 Tax=Chitinophaga qingshengii TaxID=1569794 RepID=A0ABR7TKD1_9BACT|nr:type I CRISPR-associated protein Cas7 [Chitinophaga qingshengii]MBC9929879.1 type I CRISPR-associated protein Cas7 [Chitinophaga qingshengii]
MNTPFSNRVFGCSIIKAINANYNADFSHQPRTLPDGTVYATDKAIKYSIRNYLSKHYNDEKIFYFKSMNEEMQPRSLEQTYSKFFGELPKSDKKENIKSRKAVLENLLQCIDIRLFGGTFAAKDTNLSLHGTVQFTHGVNRFEENQIYSEQISSPFRNPGGENSMQTTLGNQFKLREGHYVHHFSINPRNLEEMNKQVNHAGLSQTDITRLKEAMKNGVTYYDSAAKAGVENEALLWVQLKNGSQLVLPSFVELIHVNNNREIDLSKVAAILSRENTQKEIEKIEIYYNQATTKIINAPANMIHHELN